MNEIIHSWFAILLQPQNKPFLSIKVWSHKCVLAVRTGNTYKNDKEKKEKHFQQYMIAFSKVSTVTTKNKLKSKKSTKIKTNFF